MPPETSFALRRDEPIDLVLGGGGIKGFGHIGALHALVERGIQIGNVDCVSIGSIIGTFFKNNHPLDAFVDIFLTELGRFDKGAFARALVRPQPLRVLRNGGVVDLRPFFESMAGRYNLIAKPGLRLIAARATVPVRPYLFEGLDYDLPTAMSACCAMPPFMRSIWVKDAQTGRPIRLVDGGLFHPEPHHFCVRPSIILKLGLASRFPGKPLQWLDRCIHVAEMLIQPVKKLWVSKPGKEHLLINNGDPRVATFTFNLTEATCKSMVRFGYDKTRRALDALEA